MSRNKKVFKNVIESGEDYGFKWYVVSGTNKVYLMIDTGDETLTLPKKHLFQFVLKIGDKEGVLSMDFSYRLKSSFSEETRVKFMGMYFYGRKKTGFLCFHFYSKKKEPDMNIHDEVCSILSEIPEFMIKKDLLGGWCEVNDEIIVD